MCFPNLPPRGELLRGHLRPDVRPHLHTHVLCVLNLPGIPPRKPPRAHPGREWPITDCPGFSWGSTGNFPRLNHPEIRIESISENASPASICSPSSSSLPSINKYFDIETCERNTWARGEVEYFGEMMKCLKNGLIYNNSNRFLTLDIIQGPTDPLCWCMAAL